MELNKLEQGISFLTVRGCAYFEQMISMDYLKERVGMVECKYPWIHYRVDNGELKTDNEPKYYEKSFQSSQKLDFVTNVLSDCSSLDSVSFWLCSMEGHKAGALVVVACHSFTDGPNIGYFLSDLLSSITSFVPQDRYDWKKMIENVDDNLQPVDVSNMLSVPPNPSPANTPIQFKARCFTYDTNSLLSFCKKHNVRPQSVFSAAELYSIINSVPHPPEFAAVNLISCNSRPFFGLPEDASLFASAGIYSRVQINGQTQVKDVITQIHSQLHELMPKHVKSAFKGNCLGSYTPALPTASISNIGKINTDFKDIWIQGGMNMFPEVLRPMRNFTFHGVTTGGQLNMVCTYLVPGCEDEFISKLLKHFDFFMTHIELVSEKTIILDEQHSSCCGIL